MFLQLGFLNSIHGTKSVVFYFSENQDLLKKNRDSTVKKRNGPVKEKERKKERKKERIG